MDLFASLSAVSAALASFTHGIIAMSEWFLPIIYGALEMLPSVLILFADLEKTQDHLASLQHYNDPINAYDFIVVGAGSAGCVVANRLSEHFNVLLLERGGDPNPISLIPQLAMALINHPETDYMYKTVPQRSACLSSNNQQSSWSRGRGMGGSSTLNLMVYLRGHPLDYDHWASVTGDERWSYHNVLPFFQKSEDYCFKCENAASFDNFQPQYHRKGGYLSVGKPGYMPLAKEFVEAAEWSGIPRADLGGHYDEGVSGVTYTQRNGRRLSTYEGFIKPILHRKTLTVHRHSRAFKILFRGENNEAYGVEYMRHGRRHVAYANKEIVLSAGTIDSAKLLMLSGVGPQEHLHGLGIKVHVNAPVGKNLQDHIGILSGPFIINEPKSFLPDRDIDPIQVAQFLDYGNGTLTTTGTVANACLSSSRAKAEGQGNWPDTEWMFQAVGNDPNLAEGFSQAFNFRYDVLKEFFDPVSGKDAFQIVVMLTRPKVRGEMFLRSTDFRDDPIIDPKYFEDANDEDIKVMVEGVKRAVYVAENAPSFKKLGSCLSPVPFPPCAHLPFRSDSYWECFIRHYSVSIYHYAGTTAMGPRGTPQAVVDPELRVIGTKRLRVIDAGIMPFVASVNTNGPTIMIAERGAAFVLETWESFIEPKYDFGFKK